MALHELVDAWRISARVNLYVLDAIPGEALDAKPPLKGRTIGQQFAHAHNVRLMWLQASAPDLLGDLSKLEAGVPLPARELRASLETSAEAIARLLERGLESGRIKGFKPHPAAFTGYLVAHEGYHLGEIGMVAAAVGHPLEKKVAFGMWEWGVR